jgi:DNA invertase Pin-like site-specific DNA recombinase
VHRGVRVAGGQDGDGSARKGHKLQAGLAGIIGEAFREMVAERTYSAPESRAQRGQPTGGCAYGAAKTTSNAENARSRRLQVGSARFFGNAA